MIAVSLKQLRPPALSCWRRSGAYRTQVSLGSSGAVLLLLVVLAWLHVQIWTPKVGTKKNMCPKLVNRTLEAMILQRFGLRVQIICFCLQKIPL